MSYDFEPGDIILNGGGAMQLVLKEGKRVILHDNKFSVARSDLTPHDHPNRYFCVGNIRGLSIRIKELLHAKAILQGNANV